VSQYVQPVGVNNNSIFFILSQSCDSALKYIDQIKHRSITFRDILMYLEIELSNSVNWKMIEFHMNYNWQKYLSSIPKKNILQNINY
jgi:hypothetical protein